jgi:ribonuclease D
MALNGQLPPLIYVDDDHRLRQIVRELAQAPAIAVDTESNSLHAYRERVCLIQISTRESDYIIDPLTIGDLQPLAPIFADARIEKVFHAAEYDLMCMKRDFGFSFHNLFDTMLAARICGLRAVGLGALLHAFVGVHLDKSHQRDNWGARPLPSGSLHYAQMDTHYLLTLRDHLAAELTTLERMPEARETFDELCRVRPASNQVNADAFWRIALPNHLTLRQTAILRELYLWREEVAESRDVPPFKVMGDKSLIALAIKAPSTRADLAHTDGLGESGARRYGHDLLRLIERGKRAEPPAPPPTEPAADPRVIELYTALREWRRSRAAERNVESDVIVTRDALWALAETMPTSLDDMRQIQGLGPWRLEKYGEDLLNVIQKHKRKKR